MANTGNTTGRTRTTKAAKSTETKPVEVVDAVTPVEVETVQTTKVVHKARDIDPNQMVAVKNGFPGKLVYKSKKTGEVYIWEAFGDEQDMDLAELKNAKNSSKAFFLNNWFMFDEAWVMDYLGVTQHYRYTVSIEEFDNIFRKDPVELENIISGLPDGQKSSIAYRARALISAGDIDSIKVIQALERALHIELIER